MIGCTTVLQQVSVPSDKPTDTVSPTALIGHPIAHIDLAKPTPWPAPKGNVADVSPPSTEPTNDSQNLWALMRTSMHLPLHEQHLRVRQEINWYKRNPKYLFRLAKRIQTYLPYIVEQVALRDLPVELALLPIVESALDIYAFSHGGAAGPWQFIRSTARQYKLNLDSWYDGRRDIIASTDAALNLLTNLHARYDDWYLALAAYNAGPGNVNRARRKHPGGDYFDLDLPRETKAYVPRLLALASVIKDPHRFGLALPEIENVLSFTSLSLYSQFQLNTLADLLNMPLSELESWNPALARWATSPRGPHRVIVPLTIDPKQAQLAIDELPPKWRVDWREITVRNGDTVSDLALRHKTDVQSLITVNNIPRHRIRAGQKLLIPTAGKEKPLPITTGERLIHVVVSGESLWTISRKYKTNLRQLMKANRIGPNDPLRVGTKLIIPGQRSDKKVVRTVNYHVRRGDSLARIAVKFNVTVKQIADWNGLDLSRYIHPGQALKLHVNVLGG